MENDEKKEVPFITEKIKDVPVNKKKLVNKVVSTVLFALLFAVIASFVMALLVPILEKNQKEPEEGKVVITVEESVTEELESEVTEAETETTDYVTQDEWEAADYQLIQRQLYSIAEGMEPSVVSVTAVKQSTDWFNSVFNSENTGSGVIVAETAGEILILTEYDCVKNAEELYVTFVDGSMIEASLKQKDLSTGLAVVTVSISAVDQTTRNEIEVATLANSKTIKTGTVVLSLASPSRGSYSIKNGMITSTGETIQLADETLSVFKTDIVSDENQSGVLLNISGDVIGFIREEDSEDTVVAVAVSEIKTLIEKLSNGEEIPYLGLYISTVTSDIAEQFEVPEGVYVNSVEMDSPAMNANILSGDVIVEVNGTTVETVEDYRNALMEKNVGDSVRIVVQRLGSDGYTKVSCTATLGVAE